MEYHTNHLYLLGIDTSLLATACKLHKAVTELRVGC